MNRPITPALQLRPVRDLTSFAILRDDESSTNGGQTSARDWVRVSINSRFDRVGNQRLWTAYSLGNSSRRRDVGSAFTRTHAIGGRPDRVGRRDRDHDPFDSPRSLSGPVRHEIFPMYRTSRNLRREDDDLRGVDSDFGRVRRGCCDDGQTQRRRQQ